MAFSSGGYKWPCYWKFPQLFSVREKVNEENRRRRRRRRGRRRKRRRRSIFKPGSLLAAQDFLPCVTVSVIAMSHFKGFMRVDGWSTTRERTIVKIPINGGQRNMTPPSHCRSVPSHERGCRLKLYPISPGLRVSAPCQFWQITLSLLAGSCPAPLSAHAEGSSLHLCYVYELAA